MLEYAPFTGLRQTFLKSLAGLFIPDGGDQLFESMSAYHMSSTRISTVSAMRSRYARTQVSTASRA